MRIDNISNKTSCVYAIYNKDKDIYYIGSTNKLKKRMKLHLDRLNSNIHHAYKLQRDWNVSPESFQLMVLEETLIPLLIEREQWWIDNTNSLYNVCEIAQSSLGVKRTDETKEKIRQANLGLKHPQWRNDIKSVAQGGDNHWTKKKSFTEESKQKMSETHKQLFKDGYKHPNTKAIIQYTKDGEFVKEWISAAEVQRETGFQSRAIVHCLKGRYKTSCGYIWRYKNEE